MNPHKSTTTHLIANQMWLPSMFVRHPLRLPSTISPRTQTCDHIQEKQWDTAHSAGAEDGVSAEIMIDTPFQHTSVAGPFGHPSMRRVHPEDMHVGIINTFFFPSVSL